MDWCGISVFKTLPSCQGGRFMFFKIVLYENENRDPKKQFF